MGCLKCNREVHPESPEALTPEFACTVKDGQCLRVNCHCLECTKAQGIWCSKCGREVRAGQKPGLANYECRVCWPTPVNQQCWCAAKAEAKDAKCPIHD